ncbi:hypothetical protein M422DRAFT_64800 [Sphaerobolus stellatus SS14]|nr:hypothetical protein M422DRAFT_64800 [Sphaerobolus stellatus SS14]
MTSSTNSLHEYFRAGQQLPLRWLRLPLLLLTIALSATTVAVGAQALDKGARLEKQIKQFGESAGGVTITFDMSNIKAICIVLTLFASLLTLISIVFTITLASDWIRHLVSPKHQKGLGEKELDETPRLPFSTRTLKWQTISLSFMSLCMLSILIPSTIVSRTGSGRIMVNGSSNVPGVFSFDTRYWDYGFLRCVTSAPWFSLIFSAPTSIVTYFAWRYVPSSAKA